MGKSGRNKFPARKAYFMGDFSEHILFGFLTAFIVFHFSSGFLNLTYPQVVASSVGLLAGSILPDIDHKNSRIHRSVRAAVSLGAGLLTGFTLSSALAERSVIFLFSSAVVYLSFSLVKIRHRGFTHSISFAVILMSLGVITSFYTVSSAVPGLALGTGLVSHLLLDTEFKLS